MTTVLGASFSEIAVEDAPLMVDAVSTLDVSEVIDVAAEACDISAVGIGFGSVGAAVAFAPPVSPHTKIWSA